MGACNDCGASVADLAALIAHARAAHPGMGRLRFWDGTAETVTPEPSAPPSKKGGGN